MKLCAAFLATALALAAQDGKALFRSNCAFCHGLAAEGGRGPNLRHPLPDDDVKRIVKNGIPGTSMPAFQDFQKDDLEKLVIFLHGIGGNSGPAAKITGDPTHGAQIYASNGCASCHQIGQNGGVFGPELTRIGSARSAEYIRASILDPSDDILPEYEGLTITTSDGRKVTGVRINEDTFSVQIRRQNGAFAMFDKSAVKEVVALEDSLMPAYTNLPARDLQDLLAYLDTLRGGLSGTDLQKAKGIH